ncbi:hypothetical protein AMECASPLE_020351 [Ameca splendens]|uniref:Uncharacterized protein n=1 Tax=Ameca splendens TaxID=208324 RepID=A0ABV0YQK9_9TELE
MVNNTDQSSNYLEEKEGQRKSFQNATSLAFTQVSEYSQNTLIKLRVKPRQTSLDSSLGQKSRTLALPRSSYTESVSRTGKVHHFRCSPFQMVQLAVYTFQ